MAPFFGRLKGNAGATNPSVAGSPAKKDLHAPPMTPLEKMLLDSGPLQADGSDKFFGMENPQYGNTCYCNSILQCLYYSVPFRESVINYPKRTPIESLTSALSKNLQFPSPDAAQELDPSKPKPTTGNTSARSAGVAPNQPQKPEDKDSPEYKKKMAMQTLPVLETTDNSNSYGMPESLFTSMKDLFESVVASQFRMGVIRPQHFLDTLRREHEMFRTAMHQDAHEFLILLLNEVVQNVETESNRIESDKNSQPEIEDGSEPPTATSTTLSPSTGSKSPNTTRWVHELFEGTLTSETQCLTCEKVSQRDEVFLDLSVDLEQHSSVTSCLRKFSEEEMLCERNKFHCDNCGGLQEAEKRMKIKRLPRILALHLKRFKYTEDLQRLQKLFHRVVYPYHLRLFNTTDDAEDPDRLYELYAVVVHIGGGPYHGHYVAIIKTEDHGWLLFDDEMVEPVDKNYVRNFFGDRPGLACAYVLFYQETTLEAVQKEQEQEARNQARASSDIPTKMNGGPRSPELNRVNSAIPIRTSEDAVRWAALNHATSAPPLPTHPEHVFSTSPPVPPIPVAQSLPLGSKKSEVQLKKERQKEEKERKAAEKEKEKAEKQKRKDAELRLREAQRQQESDLKAAMEASKASKAEEDRRNTNGDAHHAKENGLTGSLGRFKRGSKSISHKLSTTVIKDKDAKREEPPSVPKVENAAREGFGQQATNNGSVAPPVKEPIRKDEVAHPPSTPDQEKHGHGHHKWKSFSLRKKSFSMLS